MTHTVLDFLHTLNPFALEAITLVFATITLFYLGHKLGKDGLYLYTIVGVIIANIQALKAVQFPLYPEPIALGSTVFTSLFVCSELLNEYYGEKAAKRAIQLGFWGYFLLTVFLLITIGYAPIQGETLIATSHTHLEALFKPAPGIFIASMLAYFLSQWIDIKVFRHIRNTTHKKYLWLRGLVAAILAIIVDNAVFSTLAWYFFAENPYSFSTILETYIIGVFWMRCLHALCFMPVLYAGRKFLKVKHD